MSDEGTTDDPVTEGDGSSEEGSDVTDRETAVQKSAEEVNGVATDDGPATGDAIDTDRPATEVAADEDLDLAKRADIVEQRELGLDKRAEDLDERRELLDEQERELDADREKLAEKRSSLEEREAAIEQRESELDERELQIQDREAELDQFEAELERKDQTIRAYVGEQVENAVDASIGEALEEVTQQDTAGRFGPTGGLLVGLAGLGLVVGGVAVALATQASSLSAPLASTTANVVVSAVLIVVGLGANLSAATDRV
jgi:ribonuclease Y